MNDYQEALENIKASACEKCHGEGTIEVEVLDTRSILLMLLSPALAPVGHQTCEHCDGNGFEPLYIKEK